MATLIPEIYAADTRGSELRVLTRLRDELPEDSIVLHSVGVSRPTAARKPWLEIDFVILDKRGIFCVEAKGGGVSRTNGLWVYTTRFGRSEPRPRGPFEQANIAAASLHQFLKGRLGRALTLPVLPGVIFPDCEFSQSGYPDIDLSIRLDASSTDSYDDFLSHLHENWQNAGAVGSATQNPGRQLSGPRLLKRISDTIRGDFEIAEHLGVQIHNIEGVLLHLTDDQVRTILGLTNFPRTVVRGGPGTGKTVIAIAEARRLAEAGHRVLYTCFNRLLAEHVARSIEHENVSVQTFQDLVFDLSSRTTGEPSLDGTSMVSAMADQHVPAACAYLVDAPRLFDAIIVDEAQDLFSFEYVGVLDALANPTTQARFLRVFLDPNQDIFSSNPDRATEIEVVVEELGLLSFTLSTNCRNTFEIARCVELRSDVHLLEHTPTRGPDVRTVTCVSPKQVRDAASSEINGYLRSGCSAEEIVILGPHSLQGSSLSEGLQLESGVRLEPYSLDSGNNTLRYAPIAHFKGLEANVIVLIDVAPHSDANAIDKLSNFVGCSRARAALVVIELATQ